MRQDEIVITPLLGNYGIADIPQDRSKVCTKSGGRVYRSTKRCNFATYEGRQASCVNPVQNQSPYLFGKGNSDCLYRFGRGLYASGLFGTGWIHTDPAAVGSVDPGQSPQRVSDRQWSTHRSRSIGHWKRDTMSEREALSSNRDTSGHGTAVLGIAAGMEEKVRERSVA